MSPVTEKSAALIPAPEPNLRQLYATAKQARDKLNTVAADAFCGDEAFCDAEDAWLAASPRFFAALELKTGLTESELRGLL